jgi:hypothetical protein
MQWFTRVSTTRWRAFGALAFLLLPAATLRADVVTWYAFDNNLADTAVAGVGANNLTPRILGGAGAESYEPGILGSAVRIDQVAGTAFVLQAPDAPDLRLATNWTLEAYIKPDIQNVGEWDRFWTKWGEGSNDFHWTMRYPQDGLDLFINNSNNIISGNGGQPANQVKLNQWSHVAVVGNSADNSLRAYINGNEVAQAAYVGVVSGVGNMNFGNFGTAVTNDLQWTGLIDDAKIHNAAVTQTYLQQRAALIPAPPVAPPPTAGLVSYWTFDGTTNDVAATQPQNVGVSADNFSPRAGASNFAPGRIGQAISVGVNPGDATDLTAIVSPDVNLPATYTIEMWVNPSELTQQWQRLALNWGPTAAEHAYHFAIRNTPGFANAVSLFQGETDGGEPNANGGTVVANQWQHLVGVADGTSLRVYLNGELVSAAPYDGTIRTLASEGLGLGDSVTSQQASLKFNGLVDDMAIWNIPLTPEQVRYQYQQGLLGVGATVPEPSTLALAAMAGIGMVVVRVRKARRAA